MGLYAERIFPWLLDRSLSHPAIESRRRALVAQASGEVLEIGFGSGATLPFYDPARVTRLTVVEPSAGMNRRAAARLAASPVPVDSVPGAGEALPFAAASFDTLVCCLTLCSVADPPAVLAEVRRVLRPGGRFLFLEHVASDDPARRRWQARLTPLQKVIAVGCHLDRDSAALVRAAGFTLAPVVQEIEPAFGAMAPLVPLISAAAAVPAAGATGPAPLAAAS
ncbi:ubiquinone biosynthesis methyltransferase UbiE [alpha proteobacterium AAP81b]|nr:ubiquinone biosynthesis methyltransferase UbiE [alpha proteobacterium AAP81b]